MKKLTEIRNDILKAVESGDKLGAKFAINNLDTYITKKNRLKSESITGFALQIEQLICSKCNKAKELWLDGMCEDCTINGFFCK